MANPFAIASAGFGVASALGSFFGKRSQAKELRLQTLEQVRRDQATNNTTLGTARVRAAGSGLEFESGSLQDWLKAMDDEFTRQEAWTRRTGMKAARSVSNAATWGLIGDLGGTMMSFGQANNWFRQPPAPGGGGGVPYYIAKP